MMSLNVSRAAHRPQSSICPCLFNYLHIVRQVFHSVSVASEEKAVVLQTFYIFCFNRRPWKSSFQDADAMWCSSPMCFWNEVVAHWRLSVFLSTPFSKALIFPFFRIRVHSILMPWFDFFFSVRILWDGDTFSSTLCAAASPPAFSCSFFLVIVPPVLAVRVCLLTVSILTSALMSASALRRAEAAVGSADFPLQVCHAAAHHPPWLTRFVHCRTMKHSFIYRSGLRLCCSSLDSLSLMSSFNVLL